MLEANGQVLLIQPKGRRFRFTKRLKYGERYELLILSQPKGSNCHIVNGTGRVTAFSQPALYCVNNHYRILGNVVNLLGNSTVTLGGSLGSVTTGNGGFEFPRHVILRQEYSVSISEQPVGQTCEIVHGAEGSAEAKEASNVVVSCSPDSYSLGGYVIGLSTGMLELQCGSEQLKLSAKATSFQFNTRFQFQAPYLITITSAPASLFCTITNADGTIPENDVTTVFIRCVGNHKFHVLKRT